MRTISTIIMIIFAIFIVFIAPAPLGVACMAFLTFYASYELIKTLKNDEITKNVYIFAVSAGLTPIYIYMTNNSAFSLPILALIYAIFMSKKYMFKEYLTVFNAMFILPLAFNSLTNIYLLENGKYYLMLPVICASVTDIFAYLTGKAFGKHKLAPNISPNKTIEGAIGGVISCVLVVCLYSHFTFNILGITTLVAMLIGLLGSISGILGDLFFSKIKREAQIKDFSNLIPGHGGVLDRFDSMIFTSTITYLILSFI